MEIESGKKKNILKKVFFLIVGIGVLGGLFWYVNTYVYKSKASYPLANFTMSAVPAAINIEQSKDFVVTFNVSGQKVYAIELFLEYDPTLVEYFTEYGQGSGFSEVKAAEAANYFDSPLIETVTTIAGTSKKQLKLSLVSKYTDASNPDWKTNVTANLKFRAKSPGTATVLVMKGDGFTQFAGAYTGSATYFDLPDGNIQAVVQITGPAATATPTTIPTTGPGTPTFTPVPPTATPTVPSGTQKVRLNVVDKNNTPIVVKSLSRIRCEIGKSCCTSANASDWIVDQVNSSVSNFEFTFSNNELNNCRAGVLVTSTLNSGGSINGTPQPDFNNSTNGADLYYSHVYWPVLNAGVHTATMKLNLSATPVQAQPTRSNGVENVTLNMKVRFQGVIDKPRDNTNQINVEVALVSNDNSYTKNTTATFTPDGGGLWSGKVNFDSVPLSKEYNIYVKGQKHLRKRVCDLSPRETIPGGYRCNQTGGEFTIDRGTITLKGGENNVDFTSIVMLAGDIPEQDGVVDIVDIAFIIKNFGNTQSEKRVRGDLNFDGIIDTQDYTLVLTALGFKYDEE